MRNRVLKAVILIAVFIGGVFFFSRFMNHQQVRSASDLSNPTLPVMYVDLNGNKINQMNGFVTRMDAADMRASLIPMTTDRSISVSYRANGNDISSVSYEITSPDTGKVVENAKITNFKPDGDYKTATISLAEPILMNREYPIRFTIKTDDRELYYYSRILQRSDLVTDKYVQFVYDFYENCTNPQVNSDLNSYLETDETIQNRSYTSVDIKSSLEQVTWGNLHPQIYRKAIPVIREINAETCSLTNDYLIRAEDETKQEEIYHVHEFYRLRYYNAKMMLLDFQRDAEQVFDGNSPSSITAAGVNLGVADSRLSYLTNEANDTAAFVQDGDLWEYSENSNKLSKVFSFHNTAKGSDDRDDNHDYSIHLIRISESGDIDFAVYGYMSRGDHEGRMGISLCHYNSESSIVTERAFIEYPRSYGCLKSDLARLSYYSTEEDACFLYLDRIVYRLDLKTGKTKKILEDINPDCFVSSDSQSKIAYMKEMDKNASTSITLLDLDSGRTREISAADRTYVRALGFLNEDLLYGIAAKDDLRALPAGNLIYAMGQLKIESFDGSVIKDYHQDQYWVTDIAMTEGLAKLTRVMRDANGNYASAPDDTIMNNLKTNQKEVAIDLGFSGRQGTTVRLKFPRTVTNLKPLVTTFSIRYAEQVDSIRMEIPENDRFSLYYVYAFGHLEKVLTDPAEAVTYADAHVGVVVNQEGQYIYERGNKKDETELHNEDIPSGILGGQINADALQSAVGDKAAIMNLSGCTLDQVLYQVSQGRAVVTKLADGSTTVIVGYDRYNTLLYNYQTGEHYYMGINDSTASMEQAGNVFVSYVESQATIKADN